MSRNYSSTAIDTTLASGVSPANTTITVASTTGFPAAPYVLAIDAGAASQELVLVTAVGGLTLTVTRGYDSTIAATHEAGATVSHSHAAIDFREAGLHIDATAAHGATGAVVGTTNVQTLTNKTLSTPSFTALPAGVAVTNGANCNAANTKSFLRGPVVIVDVDAIAGGAGVAVNETLFTLAVGHRPVALSHGDVINTTTAAPLRVHAETDGTVKLQGTLAAGQTIRGSFTLPL